MEQSPGESNQSILQIALYVPTLLSLRHPFKCSDETHRMNTHNSTRSNARQVILHLLQAIAGVVFDCSTCRLV